MPTMIRITSKRDGFRRAGMSHSGTRDYPAGTFTAEQLEALTGEPMLVVDEVDVPDLSDGDTPDGGARPATSPRGAKPGKQVGPGKGKDEAATGQGDTAPHNPGDASAGGDQ